MIKYSWLAFLVLMSCAQGKDVASSENDKVQFATTFALDEINNVPRIFVKEPWPGAQNPIEYSIHTPFKRIVCTSTTHLAYFELLGKEDLVVGFPNVSYISSKKFQARAKSGELTDLGPDGAINLELLLGLQPDAVVAFDMGGESTVLDKIAESGIPVFYNSDFLETSPLGRAEWIKFFGALVGERAKADSIFNEVSKEYLRLTELAKTHDNRPTILNGVVYGDVWFLPGGKNWASTFYEDAGGEYLWKNDESSGWLELSFEAVYDKGREADVWIGTSSFDSRIDMISAEPRYQKFDAFENGEVYNYSKRTSPAGGFDYFESAYARPDLVLSDLIKILHPELLPKYETYYFEKLK